MPNISFKVIQFTDSDSDNTHVRLITLPGPPVTVKDDNNGLGVHSVVGSKEIRHFRSYSRNFSLALDSHESRSEVQDTPNQQVAQLSQRDRATHELLRFAKLRSGIFEPPFWGHRGNVGASLYVVGRSVIDFL